MTSVGQQVQFWDTPPVDDTDQPEVAFVCFVHESGRVNLFVINSDGHSRAETNVVLDGDELTPRSAVTSDASGDPALKPAKSSLPAKPSSTPKKTGRAVGGIPPKDNDL